MSDHDADAVAQFLVPQEGPHHPGIWYERCLKFPEHAHLKDGEPRVGFLLRSIPKIVHERLILGTVHMPSVTGSLREVFEWMLELVFRYPLDFLIILDAEYWLNSGDRQREILMFHELSHCVQKLDKFGSPRFHKESGSPVWGLQAHDVEEFTAVVARYGAHSQEIVAFVGAAQAHAQS